MDNKVYFPKSTAEAVKILSSSKDKVFPLAGGTTLLLNLQDNISFIDLEKLNLDYIKPGKKFLSIGAMTTIGELLESAVTKKIFNGFISSCALTIAATPNRNLITIGGNIVGIHPWSAMPGILLLLDGEITTAKKKNYKAKDFFAKLPKTVLGKDIVAEIKIPNSGKDNFWAWKKFSLTETDYPIISMGVVCEIKNNAVKNIRIAATGLALLPQRFYETEKMLDEKELTEKNMYAAIEIMKNEAKIGNDIRVSADYKKEILGGLLTEILDGADK